MSISIRTNIESLQIQRNLGKHSAALGRSFERLSTGMRINRASDDAAGLALAESLRADVLIAGAAIRNVNDGISMVTIADTALAEIGSMLTRMAELAETAANGTFDTTGRSSLQAEFAALGSELSRIVNTTEFNNRNLLNNSGPVAIQVGLDSSANSQITISGVSATLETLQLGTSSDVLIYSLNGTTDSAGQAAALTALGAVRNAIDLLSIERGSLGASESRLTVAVSNLEIVRENLSQAESQIRDVDIAFEAAELVRLQILRDASAAVLAQANQQPAIALALLS